jgi:hypothetical protein
MNCRKLLASMCLAFFILVSLSFVNASSTMAIAGHSPIGGYHCTCGCGDCICDPGETPMQCNRVTPKQSTSGTETVDLGSASLLLALLLFALIKARS